MEKFVQLHIHNSMGSLLDGVASPEDYAKRASEYGHEALAVTDHGRLIALYNHQQSCLKYGIKPIFGMEAYLTDELVHEEDGKRKRTHANHLILLVKNETGYKNLLKLNYISNKDTDHFYYVPRITEDELFENGEGLIVNSACIASKFSMLIRENKIDDCEKLIVKYLEKFKEDFYIEIQLNELTKKIDEAEFGQKTVNEVMMSFADKYGIPIILTSDTHYLNKEDNEIQNLSIAMRSKETRNTSSFHLEAQNLYYHKIEDFLRFNKEFGYNYSEEKILQYCSNAYDVSKKCDFLIPERKKMLLPYVYGSQENDDSELIKKAREGLKNRLGGKITKEYKDRLNYELEILLRKGFSSYILILEDLFRYVNSKETLYHGIARGSGGGSLVLYSLGITELNPLKYGLLFERFLSAERAPDFVINYFCEDKNE